MKDSLLDILKGKFLVSGDAPKNWRFLFSVFYFAFGRSDDFKQPPSRYKSETHSQPARRSTGFEKRFFFAPKKGAATQNGINPDRKGSSKWTSDSREST